MEPSPETKLLIAHLKRCYEENKIATYLELEAVVYKIRDKRWLLTSAIAHLKKNYGYLFKVISGTGYQPIRDDEEKIKTIINKRTAKIYSQSSLWREEWGTINTNNFSKESMVKYIAGTIKLSAQEVLMSNAYNDSVNAIAATNVNSGPINYSKEAIRAIADVS